MTEREAAGEIILDGVRYPLLSPDKSVQFSDLARFQQKILFGDPSKDDNDLLSAWQISDLSGGSGVAQLKEGTDQGRFSHGTLYARFPGMITKPTYFGDNEIFQGTGNKTVLGEMWSDSLNDFIFIYTAGVGVRRGMISSSSGFHIMDNTVVDEVCADLTLGSPVGPGVSFQGTHTEERFYIPLGNNGFAYLIDTGTTLTESASPKFVSFAVFDNKLIGITTGGRMYRTVDGTTWTPYDLTYQLSKSYRIRKIIPYYDRGDRPTLFVLTDRDMWQFDPDGPELFRIDSGWASHKYHAHAACVWNGQLFVATGMSVKRFTGGTWMPVGLDRDFGLPAEYQGHIVEMVAGLNGLYALVQADGTGSSVYGSKSTIHEFSGSGWQCIWSDDTEVPVSNDDHATLATTAYTVTGLLITQSAGRQTMVFSTAGTDDNVYTGPMNMNDANPRAGIYQGQLFGPGNYYYLQTGEFDADMMGYTKIGNTIQFTIEEPVSVGVSDDERDTFRVLYSADRGDWVEVCSVLAIPGKYTYPLGELIAGTSYTEGIAYERIEFRFEIQRATSYNADKPMILTNFVHSFLKTVSSNDAFNVAIDVGHAYNGYSPAELSAEIDGLTTIKRFCLLTVGTENYRVFVSQNKGKRGTGDSQIGTRELSIVQIPVSGFA